MNKKISIVVPVYNVEKYLERCIKSLINQSLKDIEIILVNDGSTDRSLEICNKYAQIDKRITVINKKNGGLSDARNEGFKYVNSDYVWFVDSDDYIEIDSCKSLYSIIKEKKPDIISFMYNEIIAGEIKNKRNYTNDIKELSFEEAYSIYLQDKGIGNSSWGKIFKKNIVEGIKFPIGKKAEDLATTYKFLEKAEKIILLDKALYNYDRRDDSIMGQNSIDLWIDAYKFSKEKYYWEIERIIKVIPQLRKEAQSRYFNNIIILFIKLSLNKKDKYKELLSECNMEISKIDYEYLKLKSKVVYKIYRLNPKLLVFILKNKF